MMVENTEHRTWKRLLDIMIMKKRREYYLTGIVVTKLPVSRFKLYTMWSPIISLEIEDQRQWSNLIFFREERYGSIYTIFGVFERMWGIWNAVACVVCDWFVERFEDNY